MDGEQIAYTGAVAAFILVIREVVSQYLKIRADSKDTERKKDRETIRQYRSLVVAYERDKQELQDKIKILEEKVERLLKQEMECQKRLTGAEGRINHLEEKLQENGINFRPYNYPDSETTKHSDGV